MEHIICKYFICIVDNILLIYVKNTQKCEGGKRKSKKPLMGGRGAGGDRATNFAHMWSKNVVEMEAQANCKGETQQKL